ncbi:hypothetical protein ACLOJK_022704, partial [Asimina triloba]
IEFRCSIFPKRPPFDPPPARLRSTDRSRPKDRPRRDDGSGRASTAGSDSSRLIGGEVSHSG